MKWGDSGGSFHKNEYLNTDRIENPPLNRRYPVITYILQTVLRENYFMQSKVILHSLNFYKAIKKIIGKN